MIGGVKKSGPFMICMRNMVFVCVCFFLSQYLAWSLKRSKAVNNCKRVVGVIGKGHMNGVIYALVSDLGDLRFRDLVGKRPFGENPNSWIQTFLKNLVRDTVIGVLLWFVYEQLKTGLQ